MYCLSFITNIGDYYAREATLVNRRTQPLWDERDNVDRPHEPDDHKEMKSGRQRLSTSPECQDDVKEWTLRYNAITLFNIKKKTEASMTLVRRMLLSNSRH
ncbi:hypothetical protein RRG08_041952 [Elysia crispata]|uniref:Uncharacterized protein n=1 Tax=Elysia crispata TaxID=231223 RepID=A0AAE1CNY3_9GAST|nr:hypothetical protein RRG08_041952 [Elysia crispata]